jgi:hypothetical protein
MTTATDQELITRAVADYFEGWFDGDVTRMDRALHPDLMKRSPAGDLGVILTKDQMLKFTAMGDGVRAADRDLEVTIEDIYQDAASVTARSVPYYEYLHLVRTADDWKIVNSLWLPR